jgi:hypothetical protein
MQMRHQHDVDALGIDAGGGEILQGAADPAFARFKHGSAVAALDQDQLATGVDELRVERGKHLVFRDIADKVIDGTQNTPSLIEVHS